MIAIRKMAWVGVGLAGVVLGGVMATAASGNAAESSSPTPVVVKAETTDAKVTYLLGQPEHWTDKHLRSLEADSTTDRSIYLSAVQMVQLERDQGDVRRAIPTLEALVKRTPTQQLKNAINRLLVEIALETKDYKMAEKYLNAIVDGSLIQY